MDDEWFTDKFIEIAGDLGEIKNAMKNIESDNKHLSSRVHVLEQKKADSNKKVIAIATMISTVVASLGATVGILIHKLL